MLSEIADDNKFVTRPEEVLSFESLVTKVPLDWQKIYEENLPEGFAELSGEERLKSGSRVLIPAGTYSGMMEFIIL